jgi:tetratricopeptide (TPR) repeat protein
VSFSTSTHLAGLADFSLIQRDRDTQTYSIHRMVQEVVWHGLSEIERQEWLQRTVTGLTAVFPDPMKLENWSTCEYLILNVQAIWEKPEASIITTTRWAGLLNQAGCYLKQEGHYKKAEPFLVQAIAIFEQQLGLDNCDTATAYGNLASLYQAMGRFHEAKLLRKRSLEIHQQQLGEAHLYVAAGLNSLAGIYKSQGCYGKAEPLYQRSIKIYEQQLGSDHLDTVINLNNLAELYELQGRYGEAESLLVQALETCQQKFGKDYPYIATTLNSLSRSKIP